MGPNDAGSQTHEWFQVDLTPDVGPLIFGECPGKEHNVAQPDKLRKTVLEAVNGRVEQAVGRAQFGQRWKTRNRETSRSGRGFAQVEDHLSLREPGSVHQ